MYNLVVVTYRLCIPYLNSSPRAFSTNKPFKAQRTNALLMTQHNALHALNPVTKLRWIPTVVLLSAESTECTFLCDFHIILSGKLRLKFWSYEHLFISAYHLPSFSDKFRRYQGVQPPSGLPQTFVSLFDLVENILLVRGTDRGRTGWTGIMLTWT